MYVHAFLHDLALEPSKHKFQIPSYSLPDVIFVYKNFIKLFCNITF